MKRFEIGEKVWFVQSGSQQKYVRCPDCFGTLALTVILGNGESVSIDCDCCREGYTGSRGQVVIWEWSCNITSATITGMEIDGQQVRYKFATLYAGNDPVFATKEEAEAEAVKVLAAHEADEARRFAHVKDNAGRHHTWRWNVHYHQREIKEALRLLEYHQSKLAVAKAKAEAA